LPFAWSAAGQRLAGWNVVAGLGDNHATGVGCGGLVDDATIVVVSDHGGGALEPAQAFHFQLDVLLEAMGLGASGSGEAMAFGELYRHDKRIWLNLQGVERDGVVPEEAADETAERIAARLTAMRTDDGSPVFATVVDRTGEPDWRPGSAALRVRFSGAALLAASFEDGDRTIDAAPVRLRHTDVSGAHRPEGVIALRGPAIRRGASVDGAGLYAVAPTVLYLLGLPQDRGMLRWAPVGGGVIEAAIDPAALQRSPVRMVATYPGTDREEVRRQLAEQRDAEIDPRAGEQLERLRGLGYVR